MEFSWKKNLQKAGIVAVVAGGTAAAIVLEDALKNGHFDYKKVGLGVGIAFTSGALESLRNFLKNTIIK
jgi:hypothetical protein